MKNVLISLLVLSLSSFAYSNEDISESLNKAEDFLASGNRKSALKTIEPIYMELLGSKNNRNPETFLIVKRIYLHSQPTKDSKYTITKLIQLEDEYTAVFDNESTETLKLKRVKGFVEEDLKNYDSAIKIHEEVGKTFFKKDPTKNHEVAASLSYLGQAYYNKGINNGEGGVEVSFNGDYHLAIEPQLKWKDITSENITTGISFMEKSIIEFEKTEGIQGENYLSIKQEMLKLEKELKDMKQDLRLSFLGDIRKEGIGIETSKVKSKLIEWDILHPMPYVAITRTGKCYHSPACSTINSYSSIRLDKAIMHGFRECSQCDPPSFPPPPPEEYYFFQLDGAVIDYRDPKYPFY